jgi:hypothetical protein
MPTSFKSDHDVMIIDAIKFDAIRISSHTVGAGSCADIKMIALLQSITSFDFLVSGQEVA